MTQKNKLNDLISEADLCDAGGYLLAPKYCVDKVNERVARLVKERDEARDLVKLVSQTMGTHSLLMSGWVKEWEKK